VVCNIDLKIISELWKVCW